MWSGGKVSLECLLKMQIPRPHYFAPTMINTDRDKLQNEIWAGGAYINHKLKQPRLKKERGCSNLIFNFNCPMRYKFYKRWNHDKRWEMKVWLKENSCHSWADYATPIQQLLLKVNNLKGIFSSNATRSNGTHKTVCLWNFSLYSATVRISTDAKLSI